MNKYMSSSNEDGKRTIYDKSSIFCVSLGWFICYMNHLGLYIYKNMRVAQKFLKNLKEKIIYESSF